MLEIASLEPRRAAQEVGLVQLREADRSSRPRGSRCCAGGRRRRRDRAPCRGRRRSRARFGRRSGSASRLGWSRSRSASSCSVWTSFSIGLALAAMEVVEAVSAEHLGEGVDVVGGRGGRAPGVVAAMAEQDVEVDAGEGGAAGVDARPVQVLLHQDLGDEVADLRPHHRQRVAGRRLPGGDQLPVGGVGGAGVGAPQRLADRAEAGAVAARALAVASRGVADRAGIGQGEAALGEGAAGLVGEALADRRRCLGVVLGAEAEPDPRALPYGRSARRRTASSGRSSARCRRPGRRCRRPARRSRPRRSFSMARSAC